jgi:hypothetical protein
MQGPPTAAARLNPSGRHYGLEDSARQAGHGRVAQYRAHVTDLCSANGIELDERRTSGGRAITFRRSPRRVIKVAPIRGPVSYWVALHELGHLMARRRTSGGRIDKELVAWEWAVAEARFAPSLSVRRAIIRSLCSYIQWALARQYRRHGRPRLPEAQHPIWGFIADLALPEDEAVVDRLWRKVAVTSNE